MKKLNLHKTFIVLMSLLSIVLLVQGWAMYSKTSSIINQSTRFSDFDIQVLNKAHQLKLSVVQVQQWLTDISATRARDGLNDGFDEAENNAQYFASLIQDLMELDPDNAAEYEKMQPVFQSYYDVGKQMAKAYIDEGPSGGNKMMEKFDAVAASMSKSVDVFLESKIVGINQKSKVQIVAAESTQQAFLLGSLFIVVGLTTLFLVVDRSLKRLPFAVEKIKLISAGDLTVSVKCGFHDEISEVLEAVDVMRLDILDMIKQIITSTVKLSATSDTLTQVINRTQATSSEQQSETAAIATAIHQMTATVQEVSNNINRSLEATLQANSDSQQGSDLANSGIVQIEKLSSELESAAETIHKLENNSESITSVLDVIKSIAEQTNLLALNAAIEAARAGDQGRGFAVVADEVRALASRTQQSTTEINDMIEQLLSGSKESVEITDACREKAGVAVGHMNEVNQSLSGISQSLVQLSDMNTQIASAAEQQSAVAEEINMNITRIDNNSNSMVINVEDLTKAADSLDEQAEGLAMSIGRFRTGA